MGMAANPEVAGLLDGGGGSSGSLEVEEPNAHPGWRLYLIQVTGF
jgi:hypothetical protein